MQCSDGDAGFEVAAVFAIVAAASGLGLSLTAKPTNGTDRPLVPHISSSLSQAVSYPLPVSPLYSMSLAVNRSRGRIEKDSIHSPGATRPAQGPSAKVISPRERMWAPMIIGSASPSAVLLRGFTGG